MLSTDKSKKIKLATTPAPMARKIKLAIYAMLYFTAATQIRVSGVFHMYSTLPWILSSLLIHLPFPSHSPQLPLTCLFTPTKLEATAPGCASCPLHSARPAMGPSLASAGQGFLLSGCWFFILMELPRTYCLWNFFFRTGRQNPWDREWQLQSLLVHAAPRHILLPKKLEFQGSWRFFNMFYTTPKYKIQLHFYMKSVIFK